MEGDPLNLLAHAAAETESEQSAASKQSAIGRAKIFIFIFKIISGSKILDDGTTLEVVFSLIIVYAYSKQHALEIICGIVPKPDIKNEFMFSWLPDNPYIQIESIHKFILNADGKPVDQVVFYKESAGWNTYEKSFTRGLRCIGYTDDLTKLGTIIYTDNDSITKDDTVEDDDELNSSLPTEKDVIIAEQQQEIEKLRQKLEMYKLKSA
jgi:hypothetical protein